MGLMSMVGGRLGRGLGGDVGGRLGELPGAGREGPPSDVLGGRGLGGMVGGVWAGWWAGWWAGFGRDGGRGLGGRVSWTRTHWACTASTERPWWAEGRAAPGL